VRRRLTGFTLVEIMIVVLIIGILAAIAIPKFSMSKDRAYIASMVEDLRNLETVEESYFFTNSTYTTTLPAGSFQTSKGNTVTIMQADKGGWSAMATSVFTANTTPSQCGVFVGDGTTPPAVPGDSVEGVPGCS